MQDIEVLFKKFERLDEDLRRKHAYNLLRIIGIEAKKDVLQNFKDEGFDGEKWVQRSEKTNRAYDRRGKAIKGRVYSSSNPLLKQSGNMRDSIDYRVDDGSVFIGVNASLIPYAEAHNEGVNHQPKRQFLGMTARLQRRIKEQIINYFNKYLL